MQIRHLTGAGSFDKLVSNFMRALAVSLLLCLQTATGAGSEVVVINDGEPGVIIVVPDQFAKASQLPASRLTHESVSVALAAVELADYLGRAGGKRPSLFAESAPEAQQGNRIFVGLCQATIPVVTDPLLPEELLVLTRGSDLHLVGGDLAPGERPCHGTLYAVYDFLEKEVGVRWLFPGEHGEVVPQHRRLLLSDLNRRYQPPVAKRKVRNVAVSREETFRPLLEKWGIPLADWKTAHGPATTGPWFVRQRLGARIELDGGHAYDGWYETHGKTHPEWFALQPDGTRHQKLPRERLCKSNPALWDEIARVLVEEFKADPKKRTASLAPNDGGANKFCLCDACRSLDPPEAPKLQNDSQLVDPATGRPFPEYPSLSDRVFTFFNEVAKRVRTEMPDRDLVCYAYSVYRSVPVRVKSLEPNLIVGYVGLKRDEIEAWARIAPRLYIRPNDLGPAIDLGLPRNHAAWFAESVRHCVDHRAVGFDFDNCHGNWSAHGLDYYVLCKALWDPDIDVEATIDDYCRAAYGPAAAVMREYHDLLAKVSEAVRSDPQLVARSPHASKLRLHYNTDVLATLERLLAKAKAIQGDDPGIGARIAMADGAVEHARLVTSLLEVAHEKETPVFAERLDAVEANLRGKLLTPELASLHSHRYLRMALSHAEREVE
jgi:hypothetical protein